MEMADPSRRWWERLPATVVDIALAAVMALVMTALIAQASEEGARQPDGFAYALGWAVAGLVLVRRRWPLAVLLATVALITLYHALNYPATGPAIPLSVALYSAAAAGHLGGSLVVVAAQLAGEVYYRTSVEGESLQGLRAGGLLLAAAFEVAVVFLGEAVHSRRAWMAEVRERLARTEADREREAERRVGEERVRIARELHDVVAHTVAVVAVQAGVAADCLDDSPAEARVALQTIRSASREAMTELEATIRVLRDGSAPAEGPLAPAPGLGQLDGLIAQAESAGLPVRLDVSGDTRPLPRAIDLTGYRIVQESLTNVLRHARASCAHVRVRYEGAAVELSITDDGQGPVGGGDGGYGLAGMRERAAAVGGRVEAGPGPQGGFHVRARLPA